jgi:predicted metal-dependent peptidase
MKKDDADVIIEKAKTGLVLDAPFWASIQLKLKMISSDWVPTMGTDGERILYNPEFVKKIGLIKAKGVLAHEDAHVVFLHPFRRGDRDPELWNIACDYAVNPIILEAGFELPEGCLNDHRFIGMDAEAIYDILKKEMPPQKPAKPGNKPGNQPGTPGPCGIQGPGQPQPQPPTDPGGCGGVMDFPHKTKEELEQKKKDMEIEVKNAIQAAKAMGKLPGGMQRQLDDLLDPTIDWREKFWQYADTYARNDYCFHRPNRRYLGQGVFLPTLRNLELGEVTMLIDASGSVSASELRELVSEGMGVLAAYEGVTLHVIFFDTVADRPLDVDIDFDVRTLNVKKGGGTDFRPPFEMIDKAGLTPVCIVVLTDGECSRFPGNVQAPVLWVLNQKNREFHPPFGEVIFMPKVLDD